jgi:flagellar export protein FliJ
MHRFHFRLQSILELRRKQADEKRLVLGAASQRCSAIEREIARRRDQRRLLLSDTHTVGREGSLEERRIVEAYALRLEGEARTFETELVAAEKEREAAAEAYRLARQKADVLERLRTRREGTYIEQQKRDEQGRIDEVAQRIAAGTQE